MRSAILSAIMVAAVPSVASAQDASAWSGFNVGLQANLGNGTQDYGAGNTYDIEGNAYGLFAGYMWANGAWAFGAELAYAKSDYHEIDQGDGTEYPEYTFNHTLDIKARVGYAIDRALVYGVLGYGYSEWEEGTATPGDLYDVEGVLFGMGVDYQMSETTFVGGEILRRKMDGEYPFDADVTTIGLRVGMKF